VVIFVPLGLIDAIAITVDAESLDDGLKVATVALTVGVLTMTGLLGEIFFSGAVAIALTHPRDERPPTLRQVAHRLRYGRLILVDLLFVLIVGAGLLLGAVPGVLAFVFLSLAGSAVEIEHRGAFAALARSFHLVRGSFWLVFWVVVPIEVVGDAIGNGLAALVHHLFGHTFLASWLAESASDIALSPLFAVAAVLLTVDLIEVRDGAAPSLHPEPLPA
jgi:hypothetical protein